MILALGFALGYETVTFFARSRFNVIVRLFTGIPLGLSYTSLLAFIVQYFIPFEWLMDALLIAVLMILIVGLHIMNKPQHAALVFSIPQGSLAVIVGFVCLALYRQYCANLRGGRMSCGASYSDLPFHLNIISSIAVGTNMERSSFFGYKSPFYANASLTYPVLPDFLSAYLYASGSMSLSNSVRIPSMSLGASFIFIVYFVSLYFTKSHFVASVSIPIWFFTGGIGFADIFINKANSKTNYIHDLFDSVHAVWFQSFSHVFNPQRSATFALPLCWSCIMYLLEATKTWNVRYFILAALYVGVLPQIQAHGYLSMALFSISLAIVNNPFKKERFKLWLVFGVVANAIAIPLCLPFLRRTAESSDFINYKPLWENREFARGKHPFFSIWWKSLGVFGVIALYAFYPTATLEQIKSYIPSLVVFLVGNAVMFQPWELDNCKVFQDGWLPLAVPLVSQFLVYAFTRPNLVIKLFSLVLFVSSIASGVLNVFKFDTISAQVLSAAQYDAGLWMIENSPVDSVVVVDTSIVSTETSIIGGRILYHGYAGWTTSHGFENGTRTSVSRQMMDGNYVDEFVAFNVSYISTKTDVSSDLFELVFKNNDVMLYRFRREKCTPKKPVLKKKRRTYRFNFDDS